jgi:hypothetical protein
MIGEYRIGNLWKEADVTQFRHSPVICLEMTETDTDLIHHVIAGLRAELFTRSL